MPQALRNAGKHNALTLHAKNAFKQCRTKIRLKFRYIIHPAIRLLHTDSLNASTTGENPSQDRPEKHLDSGDQNTQISKTL